MSRDKGPSSDAPPAGTPDIPQPPLPKGADLDLPSSDVGDLEAPPLPGDGPVGAHSPIDSKPAVLHLEEESRTYFWRAFGPSLASLIVHVALLVGLSLLVLPQLLQSNKHLEIVADIAEQQATLAADETLVAFEASLQGSDSDTEQREQLEPSQVKIDDDPLPANLLVPPEAPIRDDGPSPGTMLLEPSTSGGYKPPDSAPMVNTKGRLKEAASVEQAVDMLSAKMANVVGEHDVRIVWLFDASVSLLGDREKISQRLQVVNNSLRGVSQSSGKKLLMGAVAYGATSKLMVKSTALIDRVIKAARDVRYVDMSGRENVCTAVQAAVDKFAAGWRGKTLIVVWTDEAGDDVAPQFLESTIQMCLKYDAAVHVVGPSSVFSRRKGTQQWIHPTGRRFRLPVDRGPETALPQRLYVPYWWQTGGTQLNRSTDLLKAGADPIAAAGAAFIEWHEGNQLENISSGFGPYALTRLAMVTGGTFTMFDRPADRGRFRMEMLEKYVPDYRATHEVLHDLQYYPLRLATFHAVNRTEHFLLSRVPMPPTSFGRSSTPPPAFQKRLPARLVSLAAEAKKVVVKLEYALSVFSPDIERLHELETSERWKAWHDLTRGRLLAQQARYLEYAAACELIASRTVMLRNDTNFLRFVPSENLLIPDLTDPLREEATRLLQRCMDQHPNTPWAALAERELEHPFGIDFRQRLILPPPPSPGGPPPPPQPTILLPSL